MKVGVIDTDSLTAATWQLIWLSDWRIIACISQVYVDTNAGHQSVRAVQSVKISLVSYQPLCQILGYRYPADPMPSVSFLLAAYSRSDRLRTHRSMGLTNYMVSLVDRQRQNIDQRWRPGHFGCNNLTSDNWPSKARRREKQDPVCLHLPDDGKRACSQLHIVVLSVGEITS